ncbi:MAG: aminopeptidase P family protein, partial [Clostridia bacterium]|nr:aminopeptidase P family protein [Clostridia bacterium]
AALILSAPNRRYYTAFDASDGALWVTADEARFLTDFRYIEAAQNGVDDIPCKESRRLFADTIAQLKRRDVHTLYLEDETLTVAERRRFWRQADGVELVSDNTLCTRIWEQRRIKDEREIALIRQAQALTDDGFAYILPRLTVGRTEKEIALDLEMYMRRQGADAVAFDFIVASGENGSLPHAVPSERRLQRGDFVTLDFGATVQGYRSDMTRTVAIGDVSDEQRTVYDTVLAAQTACLQGLRAGLSGEEGDRLARAVIEEAGYGAAFGHSTGHGVGIDIHEFPRLSPRVDTLLRVGEVVTVEPGIYLEGRFGVRIEDMVVLTEDGCVDLTASPKEFLSV